MSRLWRPGIHLVKVGSNRGLEVGIVRVARCRATRTGQMPLLLLLSAVLLLMANAGCGGGKSEPPAEQEPPKQAGTKSGAAGAGSRKTTPSAGASNTAKAGHEAKTIDGIPLDVYFDKPLEVAADDRSAGGAPANAVAANGQGAAPAMAPDTAAGGTTEAPKADAPKPAAGGKVAWDELITPEVLQDEVKFIRNELQQRLTNFGAYGKSYLEIPVFSATLASLAEAGRLHPGEVAWKEQAKVIRTLAGQMMSVTSSAAAKNKTAYEEVNGAYLKICELLDRNKPDGLPDAPDEVPLAELAPMSYLMKRLDRGREWLTSNTGSEPNFTSKLDVARREASVGLVIAAFMKTESYGFSDDENFAGYANKFSDAMKAMSKAAAEKNYSEWDTNRSKASQQCDECHTTGGYRSG